MCGCTEAVAGHCGRPDCEPAQPDRPAVLALERAARRLSTILIVARCSHSPIDVATARHMAEEIGALGRRL